MFELKFAITEQKSILTGSRCPCFGIWTHCHTVFTLPALAEESDPRQPFSGWIVSQQSLSEVTIILASYTR